MEQILVKSDKVLPQQARSAWDEEIDRRKREMQENKGEE